jgi:hypothetical protein
MMVKQKFHFACLPEPTRPMLWEHTQSDEPCIGPHINN